MISQKTDLEALLEATSPDSSVSWDEWHGLVRLQLADLLEEEGEAMAPRVLAHNLRVGFKGLNEPVPLVTYDPGERVVACAIVKTDRVSVDLACRPRRRESQAELMAFTLVAEEDVQLDVQGEVEGETGHGKVRSLFSVTIGKRMGYHWTPGIDESIGFNLPWLLAFVVKPALGFRLDARPQRWKPCQLTADFLIPELVSLKAEIMPLPWAQDNYRMDMVRRCKELL